MKVTDSSGCVWVVEKRLVRRPRFRGFARPRLDASDSAPAGAGLAGDFLLGAVILVVLALTTVLVLPFVVLVVELLAAAVVAAFRLLAGRWMVVAESGRERNAWDVRGRARASAMVVRVAEATRSGGPLPPGAARETKAWVRGPDHPQVGRSESSGHVRVIRE